jgi:hypothetical protein
VLLLVLVVGNGVLMSYGVGLLNWKRYGLGSNVLIGIFEWNLKQSQWNVLRTLPSVSLLKELEKVDCSSGVS